MNRRPIFFTGTGTDIGKTHVLCALLEVYRSVGGRARVLKPVLSGFDNSTAMESDTARLIRANGGTMDAETLQKTTPWRFKAALSPDMAARREQRELALDPIASWCSDQCTSSRPTFVEGAGGIMSPIAQDGLNLDLLRELDAFPVVVAGNYLGTISHTLTALRVLDGRAAVIINPRPGDPVEASETAATLRRFAPRAEVIEYSPKRPEQLLRVVDLASRE